VHLSPDLAEVQQNLRRQVDEAETGKKLKGQVDSAIKEIQGHVSAGRFRDAERVIDRMPSEVSDLKQNLREQVSQAREQKELSGVVESAVAEIRKHVAAGDFYDARRAVDNLPYNSALDELKKKLRDQIDEAERDYRKMESEIDDLRRRVSRKLDARGIELDELARQNHVDLSIKPQLHGFLKAIDRQL
jgi:molecular chaperone DnaK (HSP70)